MGGDSSVPLSYPACSPPPWYHNPTYPPPPPLPNMFSPPPYVGYSLPSASSTPYRSPYADAGHCPEPSVSSKGPFTLKFITSRISKCQGCKGLLMSGTSLPLPPYDLIVSRMECRPYMSPEKFMKVPKTPSNAHYHLSMECLLAADPEFSPHDLELPADVKERLSMQHKRHLSSYFNYTIA